MSYVSYNRIELLEVGAFGAGNFLSRYIKTKFALQESKKATVLEKIMGNTIGKSAFYSKDAAIEYDPEDNGVVFMGKTVPQETLCHIFTFVPAKDLCKSVSRVCKYWNDILSDKHFWFTKLQVEGITLPEALRTRLMNDQDKQKVLCILKTLCSGDLPINKNLIRNPSGEDKLKYWEVRHGGDGVIVETNPCGSNPIPEESGLPTQHCFVTSYTECKRKQVINLSSFGFTPKLIDMLRPKIEISEWVSARWDCRSESKLEVTLRGKNEEQRIKLQWSSDDDDVLPKEWYKIKEVVSDYPEGLHNIQYINIGRDRQFWAGHYGAKSAGSSVKLIL